jgi:hypothetical protein
VGALLAEVQDPVLRRRLLRAVLDIVNADGSLEAEKPCWSPAR